MAANQPQGPWSDPVAIFGSGDSPDGYVMYAPAAQVCQGDGDMHVMLLIARTATIL